MANIMLNAATSVGTVGSVIMGQYIAALSLQGYVVGSGSVSATVVVEGSNNGTDWVPVSTLTMTGTARGTDGGVANTFFQQFRARLTAISGTSAAASVEYLAR